ncbi:hypothetical protein HH310_01300 [Actinoplanes sp. TBRC 11911]|uniref:DUF7824 domain-containing protein n=1 Tax=Actinoplanes sp. TBRC 11911 TaxID=2729386 RepID=UPI00145FB6A1|nr:DUF6493 family protein [Actinoplanes sp. TBRC 11911]NMO49837.1 hypothetical protein [Actinoplanes sp. TBRC 11911]
MSIEWAVLDGHVRSGEYAEVAGLFVAATEAERLSFGNELEKRIKALPAEAWWQAKAHPAVGYAVAAIGCMPSASRAAALLGRRNMRDRWAAVPEEQILLLARARSLSWLGDLGLRLADNLTVRNVMATEWRFCDTLLRAGGVTPPVTDGVALSWLAALHTPDRHDGRWVPLADRLRNDPYLDLLLPAVFACDGSGALMGLREYDESARRWADVPAFPGAVVSLIAEGRLDRATYVDATVDRLVRGDRPAWLRPFALLHEQLAPTADEIAAHTADYVSLLPDAHSPVAAIAQRALSTLDAAGRLDIDTLLAVSPPVLLRKEKTLVKAQLKILEAVARREPDRIGDILETVAAAFDHPSLDLQERALTLIARHSTRIDPAVAARLADAAAGLGGDLPARAAELFGRSAVAATGFAQPPPLAPAGLPSLPLPLPPAEMPAPIATPAELAEDIVVLRQDQNGVQWERVLAGLVSLHRSGADLATVLGPIMAPRSWAVEEHLSRTDDPWAVFVGLTLPALVGAALPDLLWQRAVTAVQESQWISPRTRPTAPERSSLNLLTLRLAEATVQIGSAPMPELVATPTHVNGSLDAAVLLQRLRRAEAEGWEPWPIDFQQALLRLPRETPSDAVTRGAEALTSPSGRQFAEWLRAGGMPDPVSTRVEQRERTHQVAGWEGWRFGLKRRVLVDLEPARFDGDLAIELPLVTLGHPAWPTLPTFPVEPADVLAMALPHHREAVAAWGLTRVAEMADLEDPGAGGCSLLPLLADIAGPFGPAMSLAMAYGLAAGSASDRVAAVDAFLTLAATDTHAAAVAGLSPGPATATAGTGAPDGAGARVPFGTLVGADLADLCAGGTIKLTRAVSSLTDANAAGASATVWAVAAAALPALFEPSPRGLPDLLELTTRAAVACGAPGSDAAKVLLGPLGEVAVRPGSSRLVTEARRLRTVLEA